MKPENRTERARQIEALASDIIEKKGLDGLSMQAVAKAAKASIETLYRWYGDKTGLLEALIKNNAVQVNATFDTSSDITPLKRLPDIAPRLLTLLTGPRATAFNRAAAADTTGTLGRALARESRDIIAPKIVALMQDAQDANGLSGADAQTMAETFFGLLVGDLQIRRVTGALPQPKAAYIDARAAHAIEMLKRLFPPA